MSFSANPARSRPSLRDRLKRLSAPERAVFNVLATALVLIVGGALLVFALMRAVVGEQATQFGNALASESAQRAAEYLVHNDLVSLSVITNGLVQLPGVVGVTIYDRYRQPLAQAGLVQATPELLVSTADILTEEKELRGTVEILLEPRAAMTAVARFDYALLGWAAFAAVLLLVVARLQRDVLTGGAPARPASHADILRPMARGDASVTEAVEEFVAEAEASTEEAPVAHLPEGPMLRIDAVNYGTLEQRLAPHLLADLLDTYSDMLARACAYYQGQVVRPLTHQCLVTFPRDGATDEDVLFRAICCAQLFFGVAREASSVLKSHGKATLQFTAALHHDTAMPADQRAIVTWEICTQAGTVGRLTVTDTITDLPDLGERLVVEGSSRRILQIELPGAVDGEEPQLQDVQAFGVLRLADPYEELLARQVKHLTEPAAA